MVLTHAPATVEGKPRPSLRASVRAGIMALTALACIRPAEAQQGELTLSEARAQARRGSPSVAAARAALEAAVGTERQAAALPNPVLMYSREQTSANVQDIAALEQRFEVGGQRSARTTAARLRREAAQSRLAATEAELDFEVARRYATALAARHRTELASGAAEQFRRAVRTVEERLAGGDVSGYEARRIQLEAARYGAIAAEAGLAERQAAIRLQTLLGSEVAERARLAALSLVESDLLSLPADSVAGLAVARSAELRALAHDAEAAAAHARLAVRERLPTPAFTAGYKRERGDAGDAVAGFVAGFAVPLPLWDRRGGAVQAAAAEARRAAADLTGARLRISRETRELVEAIRRADEQTALLARALGQEARAAIRAAEAAYAEGEITLVEWLDAVRAYHEAESAYAAVQAESFIQRAALERLLGAVLLR